MASTLHVMGDVHGQYAKLHRLLANAQLVDLHGDWIGGTETLCFVGDYVDRGPDGIGVIDLIMRLERQAKQAGGAVSALLGNHDAMLLAAHILGGEFARAWERIGGVRHDLRRLTDVHVAWLATRPAMVRHGNILVCHADSLLYYDYGMHITEVNAGIAQVLAGNHEEDWDWLLDQFSDRYAFWDQEDAYEAGYFGVTTAKSFLVTYGGTQIVHGHTPISKLANVLPSVVDRALVYADDLCVDVDGGMYMGSPGFVHSIPLAASP